ncbi:MAG: hypothetical protein GJ676_02675 [Rhodobacteraceae bacterium]|nr:hypothetical protein [Paracoccaceae bacterium]
MRKSVMFLLVASTVVASCGSWSDSRANPRNWFGSSEPVPVEGGAQPAVVNPLLPEQTANGLFARPEAEDVSVLIETVTELNVERTPSGAIITASGLSARQGAFEAELRFVPAGEDEDASIRTYEFRVVYPPAATSVGTERSRTVLAASSVTAQDLQGIRVIRVLGNQGARETRRR